jgi:CspA family cold shock protein
VHFSVITGGRKVAVREIGVVVEWRGTYGWVKPLGAGRQLLVHYTCIEGDGFRTLQAGQRIGYERVEGPRGPRAEQVRLLDETEHA